MTAPLLSLPVSVMVVDGNTTFLKHLGDYLQNKRSCLLVDNPENALDMLLKRNYFTDTLHQHFKSVHPAESDHDIKFPLFDFESFHQTLRDEHRFGEIGMIIVEHVMPNTNGFDLCRQIKHLPVKKIMATNHASQDSAIEALNEGIIDAFILKESDQVTHKIGQAIHKMQHDYFTDVSKTFFAESLNTLKHASDYKKILQDFIEDHGIVEHYRLDFQGSYVGLDASGNMYCLIVQSEDETNDLLEIAENCRANEGVLIRMKHRSHLLFLFSEADKKLPVSYWGDFLLPVTHTFQHLEKSYVASVSQDRMFGIEKEDIKSLSHYLAGC